MYRYITHILALVITCNAAASTPKLFIEGYAYSVFAKAGNGDSLSIDSKGNLYVPTSSFNDPSAGYVMRYTPDGVGNIWSKADGFGISTGNDGVSYLARRALSNDGPGIVKIEANGEFNFLSGSFGKDFTWTAISPEGHLVANVWAEPDIYSIHNISGKYSTLFQGDKMFYGSLVFASGGELFTTVGVSGVDPKFYVAQILNGELVPYAETEEFGFGLAFLKNGDFFLSSPGDSNLIYKYNALNKTLSKFAGDMNFPCGLAYDVERDILYVREQGGGDIFAFAAIPPVPEPNTCLLFGEGIFLLGFIFWFRHRKNRRYSM